jgi:hypothetical protein
MTGLLIAALAYVAFVALMEALIGTIQPNMDGGVRLTTTDAEGRTSERMLASVLRFVCGFAPSKFLRLDPLDATGDGR